jgi:hypothetical protein
LDARKGSARHAPNPQTGALPAYLRIAEHLTIEIGTGRLAPGDRLPTERSLAARYGVSMMTLSKALAVVTERGLIDRRPGLRQLRARRRENPGHLRALPAGGRAGWRRPAHGGASGLRRLPKPDDLPDIGTSRRRLPHPPPAHLDDIPVAVEEIWLDPRFGALKQEHLSESLYKTYAESLGLIITRAEDRVGTAPCPTGHPKHFVSRPAPRWALSNGAASINTATRRRPRAAGSPRPARATSQGCPDGPGLGRTRHMRYGIVGCGMMGQEHIRNIALLAQAEVSAFVEPDAGMAAATQALVPGPRPAPTSPACWRATMSTRSSSPRPNHCHLPQLQDVARIRPLPVLVEKPIATRSEDDAALRDLARTYPAPIWVAMEYRYMPPIARFRELAAEATGGIKMLTIREHRFPLPRERSATGTASTATPAARWSRNAAISSI